MAGVATAAAQEESGAEAAEKGGEGGGVWGERRESGVPFIGRRGGRETPGREIDAGHGGAHH
jgi:hypothetical protein